MKSLSHNLNTEALKADKRFEALVKKEMMEHQHLISSYQKEMQSLRDLIKISMEKVESLSQQNEESFNDFKTRTSNQISILKERMINSDTTVENQRRTIQSLHQQLLDFHMAYSSRSEIEKFKKEIESQINDAITSNLISYQDCEREAKTLFNSLNDDLNKLKNFMEQKFAHIIDKIDNNFSISRIDREGVLKEIRIYEKTIFIIEKKIENIYTLIERINKRGEACPKQE